jgi:phospholipase A1
MTIKNSNSHIFKKIITSLIVFCASPILFADTTSTTMTDMAVSTAPQTEPTTPVKTTKHKKIKHAAAKMPGTMAENLPAPIDPAQANTNAVEARHNEEKAVPPRFAISFHRPNYIMPYYYTFSPDQSVYVGNTPNGESLKHDEIKYQFSFKVPLWRNIFNLPSSLYFGYTQLSYWQAYNQNAFFRSTDYEPEVYLQNDIDHHMFGNWSFNSLNIGLVHQSNGFGNSLERSWNRAYLLLAASNPNWMIAIKPWIIFHDSTYERQNPNMATYLGYEEIQLAYKYGQGVIAFGTRNFIESSGHRSGNTLSVTFPMTKYLNGYVQIFSGYGQSLIEYNHRTNSVGIGFSLSNWI